MSTTNATWLRNQDFFISHIRDAEVKEEKLGNVLPTETKVVGLELQILF